MSKKLKTNKKDLPRRLRFKFGDRRDGYKIKNISPMSKMMPYLMPQRCDSLNYFQSRLDVGEVEKFVREKVKEGKVNFSILHIIIAAYVRAISQRPGINRFVSGQKIYARRKIEVNMVVKKELSLDSPDTCIKIEFDPYDSVDDVYEKFNRVMEEINKTEDKKGSFDKVNKAMSLIPGFILRFVIWFLNFLDYHKMMPRKLLKISPFHGSMIITSMGSLGIPPIYHHIYNFGNLPVFISYGAKYTDITYDENGNPIKDKYVDMTVVTDERICDGYYYASAFKMIKKHIEHPDLLNNPPENIVEDVF